MADLERALTRLDKLIAWAAQNRPPIERNEAATRLHLIDTLLMNVLTWPRAQVKPEDHQGGKYADYVLGLPQRQLVIEAKREGESFRLPVETPVRTTLPTLFKLDERLRPVVEQARGYAHDRGLPYAAVTNGPQLIAFLATRTDGIAPLEGGALAFTSFESMRLNFTDLWNALSRPGIEGRRLSTMLSADQPAGPPMKLSALIPGYPGFETPGKLETDLKILAELFLIDLVETEAVSDDFIKECYCSNGALSQYASLSREILKTRYSEVLGADLQVALSPVRTRRGISGEVLASTATASLSSRPIVLLGYVGVGKSMFIRHLVRVDAKDVFEKALVLYVDLGSEPALEQLEPFVAEHFIEELRVRHNVKVFERNFVRGVYHRDLEEFRSGIWGPLADDDPSKYREREADHLAGLIENREQHLRRSLEHLARGRGRQVVTILDNVDQRDLPFQDRVFLVAETLAKTWPGTVFVALRPDTFDRSKRSGTLSAYQPRVFAVAPPRVDLVIQKRIAFARKHVTAHGRLPIRAGALDHAGLLSKYLDILATSFRRRRDLTALMDNLSGGNVRRALDLLTTFISSPHGRAERALRVFDQRGGYVIPYHDFLRSIMLGDRQYYDPSSSQTANLLDIGSQDRREHFLLPILISFLRQTAEPGVKEGYVPVQRVYEFAQELGFLPEQINWQLSRSVESDLIEVSPIDGPPELYRATMVGSYHERYLLCEYTYIDEIVVDTPVVDDIIRAVLEDVRATSKRLDRALTFCDYLDGAWEELAGRTTGFDWVVLSVAIRAQIKEVEGRLGPPRKAAPPPRERED
jgi:hypothetical protein